MSSGTSRSEPPLVTTKAATMNRYKVRVQFSHEGRHRHTIVAIESHSSYRAEMGAGDRVLAAFSGSKIIATQIVPSHSVHDFECTN